MDIQIIDFNGADALFTGKLEPEWKELSAVLAAAPPHLKGSDQAGKQGSLIFDPVGTNFTIKAGLSAAGWAANVPMPSQFDFLGNGIDFAKQGVLVEVQFSNYPFLLNNTVRAELLFKSRTQMAGQSADALIVVAKGRMFPASNSTLYYEQAVKQLSELSKHSVLDIPIRLVGLFTPLGTGDATFTEYHAARYSRTVVSQITKQVVVRNVRGRCSITLA